MIPIVAIFISSESLLVSMGQDPEVSRIAKTYVCLMIPGVWAMGQFDSTKKFLSSQLKNSIPVWTQLFTTALHFLWCYIFIQKMGLRERGAAAATNITYILNMIIADVIIRMKQNTTFEGMVFFYDKSVLQGIGNYLKIGIPGMLMLCFEWWAFELLALFTGTLGVY